MPSKVPANATDAALVAMDPYTGQVLTMLGSPDYFDENIDGAVNAALALRQPGSALKPFTYAAAMNPDRPDPFTAATMLLDVETPFVTRKLESYTPANFGQVEHGPVLVREALASSFNIPAVITLDRIGIDALVTLAANAGLTSLASNTSVDLAITLGGGEVRLLDMAQAYSVFPNGGYRVQPTFLLKVTDRKADQVIYQWQPTAARLGSRDRPRARRTSRLHHQRHFERQPSPHPLVRAEQRPQHRATGSRQDRHHHRFPRQLGDGLHA